MNVIKQIVSVLLMPLAIIVGVLVILAATQIVLHETLWKDK